MGFFDAQAQLIAGFVQDTRRGMPNAERFARMIRGDRPDLSGGLRFVDSPRHTGYVDSVAYTRYLTKVAAAMGWPTEGRPPAVSAVRSKETAA